MASDSSFDIVSELNLQEMDNAINQAKKDDLQAVMAHLRANPVGIPLQFNNFR